MLQKAPFRSCGQLSHESSPRRDEPCISDIVMSTTMPRCKHMVSQDFHISACMDMDVIDGPYTMAAVSKSILN